MRNHVPETGWIGVQANGLQLACFDQGRGPLLLLLHGFPDTPHTWDAVRPRLVAAGYRVVTPFLRGYAPSQAPAGDDFGLEALGQDVLALIAALGEETAAVLGHDFGATAAYAAAGLAPAKVRALITVAIPPPATLRPSARGLWGLRHFLALRLPGAAGRFAEGDFAEVRVLFERWSPGHPWPEAEFESVRNAFAAPGCLEAALGYYRALSPALPAYLRHRLRVPALVIGGTSDGVATEADFRRSERGFEPACELAMLPGGHFLHREHPEEFARAVLGFLDRVDPRPASSPPR